MTDAPLALLIDAENVAPLEAATNAPARGAAVSAELTDRQVERLRKVLQELRVQAPGSRLVLASEVAAHLLEREPEIARALVGKGHFVRHLKALGLCEAHQDGTHLALTA